MRVLADLFVVGQQFYVKDSGSGHDDLIGGVTVKGAAKPCRTDGNCRRQLQQADSR
jgi:hypothetical protein